MNKFALPHFVDNATLSFPGDVSTLLPPWEEIPQDFQRGRSPWNDVFNRLFYSGLSEAERPKPKPELVEKLTEKGTDAWRHVMAVSRSFSPKHEHKEAGVAYLMSLWFELPEKFKK